jgi:hypothetical protein
MSKRPRLTKESGERVSYDPRKLCSSLVRSGAPEKLAQNICVMIEKEITPEMTTQQLWRKTLRYLIKSDLHDAGARYSLRRAMSNLGPDGYVFEKYIATVLEAYGYHVETNKMIVGASGVEHEIDVLAKKDGKIHLLEVKYKNQYGLRTHVDTVMYSWARYLDIVESKPETDREKYSVWLMTNTEFTNTSQKFAKYRGMVLIGWDYPVNRALEDMIAEKKLYPISILPSLTLKDRKTLIHEGFMLAQDLLPYTADDLEHRFHISPTRATKLIAEARALSTIDE